MLLQGEEQLAGMIDECKHDRKKLDHYAEVLEKRKISEAETAAVAAAAARKKSRSKSRR